MRNDILSGAAPVCPVCCSAFRTRGCPPKDIRQLIIEGRRHLAMTASAFARAAGVTRAAVQQWERLGGTSPNRAHRPVVARLLGMSMDELLTGGPRPSNGWGRRVVRVLSPVEAGGFVSVDNFGPHSKFETVLVTVAVKKHTFALRVHGESMRGTGVNSCPPGTIVVVEPAMKARPGDFVIVLNRSKQATFKQLAAIDGVSYLKPLNNRFKTRLLGDGAIIGVVREAIWRLDGQQATSSLSQASARPPPSALAQRPAQWASAAFHDATPGTARGGPRVRATSSRPAPGPGTPPSRMKG